MRVLAQIERPAEEHFALAAGLLRAHVIEGVPLERLAHEYGFALARLRAVLADHVTACAKALEIAPEVPPATPPIRIRVRERIAQTA